VLELVALFFTVDVCPQALKKEESVKVSISIEVLIALCPYEQVLQRLSELAENEINIRAKLPIALP
jgi:hypothetical protein